MGAKDKAAKALFEAFVNGSDDAERILAKITSAEDAVKLVGPEREAYLKALDAKYGDRAKRAADMGFGKKTWYHGTGADIDKFDETLLQTNASGPTASKAFHFAKDPKLANQYAHSQAPEWYKKALAEDRRLGDEAMRATDDLRGKYGKDWDALATPEELSKRDAALKRFKDYAANERPKYEARADALPEGAEFESGNNVVPVRLKTKNMVGQELDGGSVGYDEAKFLDEMKAEGKYGGVVFKNAYDNLNNIRFDAPELMVQSTDIAVPFHTKDIRSPHAAFDPRFKDSPLLMAAGAPVGVMAAPNAASPLDFIKQGFGAYREKVAKPIADKMKKTFTPDVNVRGQEYKTSSPGSDFVIETASDPINYLPGASGVAATALEAMGNAAPETKPGASLRKFLGLGD